MNLKLVHMYYRHVLTYDFSDDETRESFKELVEGMGYVEAEDQSTYVLPYSNSIQSKEVADAIVAWSKNENTSSDDFVQIFYLTSVSILNGKVTKIGSRFLKYGSKTKGLILKD